MFEEQSSLFPHLGRLALPPLFNAGSLGAGGSLFLHFQMNASDDDGSPRVMGGWVRTGRYQENQKRELLLCCLDREDTGWLGECEYYFCHVQNLGLPAVIDVT